MNIIGGIFNYFDARRRRQNIIASIIFGVGCLSCIVIGIVIAITTAIFNGIETANVNSLYGETYASACQAMPVGNEDEDNLPDAAPRKVLLLIAETQRRHAWHSDLPEQWRAENEAEVTLIGCVEFEWLTLETCEYERDSARGSDESYTVRITREQSKATIALINPETGRLIDSRTERGSEPDDCPDDEDVSTSDTQRGSEVEFADFGSWIEDYVFD